MGQDLCKGPVLQSAPTPPSLPLIKTHVSVWLAVKGEAFGAAVSAESPDLLNAKSPDRTEGLSLHGATGFRTR